MSPNTSSSPKRLANRQANEFAFKSRLTGPISELSELRKALLFAEISLIAYLPIDECNLAAGKLGFTDGKLFDGGDVQAYWFQNEHDGVIVCRGVEAREWGELWQTGDELVLSETAGRVNSGFKKLADKIWPSIETALERNSNPIWFCGHSVGAAVTQILAGRCMLSYVKCEPSAVFTYGSPRVGDRAFVDHVDLVHERWVNYQDEVTRSPSLATGYRHSGQEMFLGRLGQLNQRNVWQQVPSLTKEILSGLGRKKNRPLANHFINEYVDSIFGIVRIKDPAGQTAAAANGSPTTASSRETPEIPQPNAKQEGDSDNSEPVPSSNDGNLPSASGAKGQLTA